MYLDIRPTRCKRSNPEAYLDKQRVIQYSYITSPFHTVYLKHKVSIKRFDICLYAHYLHVSSVNAIIIGRIYEFSHIRS